MTPVPYPNCNELPNVTMKTVQNKVEVMGDDGDRGIVESLERPPPLLDDLFLSFIGLAECFIKGVSSSGEEVSRSSSP
jgi:hypothetical protein